MKNELSKIKNLIGNTPLIKIRFKYQGKVQNIFAKLEWFNLSGSIKDRPAFEIISNAYKSGLLCKGQTICETTSGNMGISICAIANITKNPVVICMPKYMSEERKQLLKLYGAKLELADSFDDAFKMADKYQKMGAFLPLQFENENNVKAQQKTAKEILQKLPTPPAFVSGVGTGGTLVGIGGYLKRHTKTKVIAMEPAESKLLSTGKSLGKHKIQGVGDESIPRLYNKTIVDKIIAVNSDDAICMAQKLCNNLGLGVGISSGANFLACVLSGINNCVTVFADDNKKYLSTDLTKSIKSDLVYKITLIDYTVL